MSSNEPICKYDTNGNIIHYKGSNGYEEWKGYDTNSKLIYYKNSEGLEWGPVKWMLLHPLNTGSTISLEEYNRRELELRKKAEQGDLAAWTEWEEWTGRRW